MAPSTPTTVSLASYLPKTYATRQPNRDWLTIVSILERSLNRLVGGGDSPVLDVFLHGDFETAADRAAWVVDVGASHAPFGNPGRAFRGTGAYRIDYQGSTLPFRISQAFPGGCDLSRHRQLVAQFWNDAAVGTTRTLTLTLSSPTGSYVWTVSGALGVAPLPSNAWVPLVCDLRKPGIVTGSGFDLSQVTSISLQFQDGADRTGTVFWDALLLTRDQTSISLDHITDLMDPLRCEAAWLPYLAQMLGHDLDTGAPVGIQRKIVGNIAQLYREKGTLAGIVNALRLLLGLECSAFEPWGQAWILGKSQMGVNNYLAPPRYAPGYSRSELTGCAPGLLVDHDELLQGGAFPLAIEVQKSARAGGEYAFGALTAPVPALLCNNLPFVVTPSTGGPAIRFEFQVDSGYVATPGGNVIPIDARTAVTAIDVAIAIVTAIGGAGGAVTIAATRHGPIVALLETTTVGSSGNQPIVGGAWDVMDGVGMVGGAAASAFVAGGGTQLLNLLGATSPEDVAARLKYALLLGASVLDVQRSGARLWLRRTARGPLFDLPWSGTAAAKLAATPWSGGNGPSPARLLAIVTPPRHLSDPEYRAATAILDKIKDSPKHVVLRNPPAVQLPPFQLQGFAGFGQAQLAIVKPKPGTVPPGTFLADPTARYVRRSIRVPLDAVTAQRSQRLIVGAGYHVQADAPCWVLQGNSLVVASNSNARRLNTGEGFDIVVPSLVGGWISVLRVAAGAAAWLRISRID